MQIGDWVYDKEYPEFGIATIVNVLGGWYVELVFWDEPIQPQKRFWDRYHLVKV